MLLIAEGFERALRQLDVDAIDLHARIVPNNAS
jgi:hypothetical protein